jgi:acyl-CoA synthetase (AMP-forming)/AMP-acid ligase II
MAFDGYVGAGGGRPDALPGGWISVGDLGSVDADGYVYLAGRVDDLIISGGVNVHPTDVEAVLGTHPEVLDCAVFGLPDAEWGEVVAAAVVSRQAIDVEQVRAWLRGRIADDKRPRRLFLVDTLPTTPSGKVSRRTLRHAVAAGA